MSRSRDLANLAGDATGLETLTVSDITDLTATATELNYVDGVSSALQTQIDAKIGGSNPTITLGSNATFPAGHIITHTPQTVVSTEYSSTGADVTCTLLTTTINKKKSGSKIHVFGVLWIVQYSYDVQNTTGDIWCNRTAPTSSTNLGKRRSEFSFPAGSQAYIFKEHLMPFSFYDDSSATGNHTYVVHCQMDTGLYFKVGAGISTYGNSTIQAYEVETS